VSQRPKRTMRAARTDGTTLMRSALAALRLSHPTLLSTLTTVYD
jgi:hypothetical protein